MKINKMNLIAYGPFTDIELNFSHERETFHMVYGPNEAGKSSALKAIRNMLFGIPVRTLDSFLHPNPKLRIGAQLIRSDGKQIEFIRRKGQSKTLRGPDGQALIDDDLLDLYLGGVDRDLFEQMFAIGHEDLVKGGEEIISGGGSVGQALFSAGAGLIRLQSFKQHLEEKCDALFKPKSSTLQINRCLSSLKKARKNQKEALLLVKTWKTHHNAFRDAQQQLEKIREQLSQLKQESGRLDRINNALPLIARKKEVDAELLTYGEVPELPKDFGEKRRKIENDLKIATNDFNRLTETIRTINEQIDTEAVPVGILHHEKMIEALQQELGKYASAQTDRPNLEGRMRTLQKQASDTLSEIGAEALSNFSDELQLPPSVVGDIQDMGKTFERLTTRLETTQERYRKLESQFSIITAKKEALTVSSDVAALKVVLQIVQDAGPIEKRLAEITRDIESREKTLINALQRQPLWSGAMDTLERQEFPSKESIDRFEEQFTVVSREIEKLEEEKCSADQEAEKIETELGAIELSHDVPTEADLEATRRVRENGWCLIRSQLEGFPPPPVDIADYVGQFDSTSNLPDIFEKQVEQADHIADRLRREAKQVNQKSLLEVNKRQIEKKIQTLEKALEASRQKHTRVDEQWQQLWEPAGIRPLTPKEMRAWLVEILAIREKQVDINSDKIKADGLASETESLKAQLFDALTKAQAAADKTDSFSKLIGIAKAHVETQEAIKSQTESIEKEILNNRQEKEETGAVIAELEQKLTRWKTMWGKTIEKLGLGADASPTAAMGVIDSIRNTKVLIDEADVLRKRIKGIDRDADTFQQQVGHLVDDLAPDLKDEPPDRAAVMLNARLTEARELQARQKNFTKQLSKASEEHRTAQKKKTDASTLLDSLCREAHCDHPDNLETIENRSKKRRQKIHEREGLETRLREFSAGGTIEALISEAELIPADSIAPELERLAGEIRGLEEKRSELDQTIGTERAELKRMDGGGMAAAYAEEAERLLASLESDVEQYARFKIATALLTRTIEQYRKKNQGPLIKRASDLFSQMTLGSFEGIRAEYDEKGNPVLVGIRPDTGEQVSVAGMSDGSADQLYLALRLASLEEFLKKNEPLPFIVDDILLRFDDDRAGATLRVLSDLSEKTQVIFFTHHDHLVQLAENSIEKNKLLKHTIK